MIRAPGRTRLLCSGCGQAEQFTPDGSALLYTSGDRRQVGAVDLGTGRCTTLLASKVMTFSNPRVSPRGDHIVVVGSGPSGKRVLISEYDSRARIAVPDTLELGAGISPEWSQSSSRIYYLASDGAAPCIVSVSVAVRQRHPTKILHCFTTQASPLNLNLGFFGMSVARRQILMNLGESSSDVWMTTLPDVP
jgi:hypothetical protein